MIDVALLLLLVVTALFAVYVKDLLSAGVMLSAYSLIMALVWTRMNAVDVAFTEASVGAGITTVLLIAALSRTRRGEDLNPHERHAWRLFVIMLLLGAALLYGVVDMPAYGDPAAPAYLHVAPRYINDSMAETGVPNMVTAVLASYRGYDTLGETTVIFTAGVSVILLLRGFGNERD